MRRAALVFGHMGDRLGRKYALLGTVSIMGTGTFLIGAVPGYGSIGVWAPVLLVLLRVMQGLGIGGEWGGAALIALEHAPNGRRGLIGSLPQMGSPAGLLVSTAVFALVAALPNDEFMAWGWRLPFLGSIVFMVPALLIRSRVRETPAFRRAAAASAVARRQAIPLLDLVRR